MTDDAFPKPALIGLSRRALVAGLPLALGACAAMPRGMFDDFGDSGFSYSRIYGAQDDEAHPLPAMNYANVDDAVLRRRVKDPTGEKPGTIVVLTSQRRLYIVEKGGTAVRYGIGVGKEGMEWKGRAKIAHKAKWPRWTPTASMIKRDPKTNGPWAGGMPGGLKNPLGARAMYLFQGGRDSSYRIHGTNYPKSIGLAMSSGCVRMFNHDVIDLYDRADVGATVIIEA
nr:L,D-transpeptidase [Chenggangzhangella methanolivorans]